MSRAESAIRLRGALVAMVTRYGSSKQRAAYAYKNNQRDAMKRHERAASRQFMAIQRLATAMQNLVLDGVSR